MRALSQSEYGEIRSLYESIYTPQVDEELELSDEELTEAVEDAVFELIEEGYDIDDIEDVFDDELIEEILDEAEVTMGKGGRVPLSKDAGKGPGVTSGSGSRMAAASRLSRMKGAQKIARQKARKEKVQATVTAVKDTAKNKTNQAKGAIASAALKTTGTKLKGKKGQDLTPQQTHTQHKSVRDKAKSAIKANIKGKVSDAKSAVKSAGGKAVTAVKNAPEKAGSAARKGLKSLIKRGADKVMAGASKVSKRMSEEVETYDVVVEFLCDYGIAEDLQEAQMMMVNEIDSEDIATILEAYGSPRPTKLPLSRERMTKKVDDWKEDPNIDFGKRGTAAKNLRSRANAVVGTQRRQDKEVGM